MKVKKIGIIGIEGKFGKWLHSFFRRRRLPVRGIDVGSKEKLQEIVEWANVAIFCVPIPVTLGLMEKALSFSRPDQLWMDVASVKFPVWELMKRSNVQYVGLHPLFAPPKAETWKGCSLVVCKRSVSKGNVWPSCFLKETEADIIEADPAEHDAHMLGEQNLVHVAALVQALSCYKLGLSPEKLLRYSTKLSRKQLGIMARMASQDPVLYADIQIANPQSVEAIDHMIGWLAMVRECVAAKSHTGLAMIFRAMKTYLGEDFVSKASIEFD